MWKTGQDMESCAKLEPETVEPATWVTSSSSRGLMSQFKMEKREILTAKGFKKTRQKKTSEIIEQLILYF